MSELKPCPFCGGEAELMDGSIICFVHCDSCKTTGCTFVSECASQAVAAWNTRATDTELTRLKRQVEVLREAHIQTSHNLACERYVREHSENALAAADRIAKEQPHDKD